MKNKRLSLLLLGAGLITGAGAQSIGPSTLNASGGSAVSGGNTYEWSIGEMALVSTYASSSLVVTQGVLQPKVGPTSVNPGGTVADGIRVYPNPVVSTLYLEPDLHAGTDLRYTLEDAGGKMILTGGSILPGGREKQTIDMEALAQGSYILRLVLTEGGKRTGSSYKIQKTR